METLSKKYGLMTAIAMVVGVVIGIGCMGIWGIFNDIWSVVFCRGCRAN